MESLDPQPGRPEGPAASIAFVLAVYNIRRYLEECLASVLAAAAPIDQIIAVDDGSTDGSQNVLDDWVARHPGRITLVRKANGGLSSARNAGLAAAHSDYILFFDGDDVLNVDAMAAVRHTLDTVCPDILVTDFEYWHDDGRGPRSPSPKRSHPPGVLVRDRAVFLEETLDDMIPCVWTRFFRSALFERLPANPFPEWSMYDDLPTTPHLVAVAESNYYLPVPISLYRQRSTSLTQVRSPRSCIDLVRAACQAARCAERLDGAPQVEVMARILLLRKLVEAIRQGRSVHRPSLALYREMIKQARPLLLVEPQTTAQAIRSSKRPEDRRLLRHLRRVLNHPATYGLLQWGLNRWRQGAQAVPSW